MYNSFQTFYKYLHYCITASNGRGHGIHSPFVFNFIKKVLNDKQKYPAYREIESIRQQLLKDKTLIHVEDFGAGSTTGKSNLRSIASITKNSIKPKKYARLLSRMVKYYQPGIILELGTSLGITSSYLSIGNPVAKLFTLEGSAEIAAIAKKNFQMLRLSNVHLREGPFNETLPHALHDLPTVDFAFIDGNHRKEPTENYFLQLLEKVNENSILVFDDIHWSGEMEEAWKNIRNNPRVQCSIDLFFMGIIFFNTSFKEKQHFRIRF